MTVFGQTRSTDQTTTRNRERAERRRSVSRTVQEHRDRLNSVTGNPSAFDQELTLTYAQNRISASHPLMLLILIVGVVAAFWVGPMIAIAWSAMVLAANIHVTALCREYGALNGAQSDVQRWRRRFMIGESLTGLAWAGLFLVTALEGNSQALDVFQFAVMLLVVSVITSLASTLPKVALTGTVPVTAAQVLAYLSVGDLLHAALAITALCALIFFMLLSTRLYSATLAMLEYRAEKDLLIAELGTAKSISDESRRRAEEANLAKSRFLATMSHELRTPLNAILGFSEIMDKGVLGPIGNETYQEYVGDIHESGQYLLNLINEILDLSRIEAGRHKLSEEPVDLAGVVSECHRLVQLKAKAKQITIVEDFQDDLPRLWADQRAIRQIALNLLSNALKFTPAKGEVTLIVRRTSGGGQALSVRDTGPGIPESEIPIVLSSFGQGSIAIDSAERGAGLGLSIVQALMATHDGSFELRSELRKGTEATAIFPPTRVMEALPPVTERPGYRRAS